MDVPDFGTESQGYEMVKHVPTLDFKAGGDPVEATDPSIGGRPLPLDAADPYAGSVSSARRASSKT